MGDPSTKDESLAELTRHALHDLLHDAGMNHRSQAGGLEIGQVGVVPTAYGWMLVWGVC